MEVGEPGRVDCEFCSSYSTTEATCRDGNSRSGGMNTALSSARSEMKLKRAATKKRCRWGHGGDADYIRYHDREWGRPAHDDRLLFEMLILEGAQAGLSWLTILRKRANYQKAFARFDPKKVARFDPLEKRRCCSTRHRSQPLKIDSTVSNARAFLAVQREFGSFDRYLWSFVEGRPIINRSRAGSALPARTELSDRISKDLKKRGFRFVGTTMIYAYLQAVGVVNDHMRGCFLYAVGQRGAPRRR